MKLVADENLDRGVILKLREAGHEVISVAEMEPGISDEVVLATANSAEAMLITEDKDCVFEANRWRYGPKRKTGARKLRGGADWGELRTLRDLQVRPVG